MKYFGERSLSSVVATILHISWWAVFYISILFGVVFAIMLFSKPWGDWIADQVVMVNASSNWREIYNWNIFIKILALPYVGVVVALQLQIIKKGQTLFTNFKNNIVFNKNNVTITSKISGMLIVYSLLTANFSLLLVSIILLIVCEIMKKGTTLQEEHDLTV
jgi:hypothetical protein